MALTEVPLAFALIGLALYTVLGGADFGAGFWQLTAGRGSLADRIREHAHHAIAPVWEANHVWLIFVLTVVWTAYPVAFGSIASTLSVPFFLAAIGIILRGTAYALSSGASTAGEGRRIDSLFALSSVLTPFALGTMVGGIASYRVPVGNAKGDLLTSWLNPTSILLGVLAVAVAAFLAAAFLAADANRQGEADLERQFRLRAITAGVVSGVVALAGLVVVRIDAPSLFHGLTSGLGLLAVICSALAAFATLVLVGLDRFGPARYTAPLAVAAVIAGWAFAQRPVLLPGLTIAQAAAPTATLVAVTVAVLVGAMVLLPSLALLFRLVLRGHFDPHLSPAPGAHAAGPRPPRRGRTRLLAVAAGGCLLAGFVLLTVAEAGWAHAVGATCLLAAIVLGVAVVAPADVADEVAAERDPSGSPSD
ncbi:MAG TPA: cytochrome d ubiquinol oxidase subunit II [Pseudonocardia sp.]|nr:cytochrome d ubiquinol oxidase subunit II [Pseudonocardia sp.]